MQTGSGHLRQQDGHVLLLLPEPDEPLPDMSIHYAEGHLLLTAESLVQVGEVCTHTGASVFCRPWYLGKKHLCKIVKRYLNAYGFIEKDLDDQMVRMLF